MISSLKNRRLGSAIFKGGPGRGKVKKRAPRLRRVRPEKTQEARRG